MKSARQTVVSVVHLGCARNLIDSELMLGRMAEQGLLISGDDAQADVVVLNTCSFIGPAREESEGSIRALIERKRRGEIRSVVVAGCLVQRYRSELSSRFPDVDLFAEISDYRELASSVRRLGEGESVPGYLAAPELRSPEREGARLLSTPGSYAYLRISHGCDHTCSFCAIPSIRGPHRSKRPEAVLDEARELLDVGVRELVLIAEDSTAWGRDMGTELPALVEALADLCGSHGSGRDGVLRLMYAYPNRFPWGLTELLREHPHVLPYLDIPVQHIATPVLRAMLRAGSGDQVRRILDRLREEVPGITLRTTVLVGFPGETERDVEQLVDFVGEYGLGRLGAFTYSPEQGTPGYDLPDRVPAREARQRYERVLAARDRVLAESQTGWIGRPIPVTVDEVHPDHLVGRTPMDAPEVDLLAIALRPDDGALAVGDRVEMVPRSVDEEFNLIVEVAAEAGKESK